jgi:hypothetical protein
MNQSEKPRIQDLFKSKGEVKSTKNGCGVIFYENFEFNLESLKRRRAGIASVFQHMYLGHDLVSKVYRFDDGKNVKSGHIW